jgi:hypothetical protein
LRWVRDLTIQCYLDDEVVTGRVDKGLFHTQMALRGLNGTVPQTRLDLVGVDRGAAPLGEFGNGAAQVMGSG